MADIARIKGNISKMIAQNAPEADIDAYVASEGVTPEQLRGPDKYQQAAIDERDRNAAAGIPSQAGYTRRLAHGATLGADNTLVAGMMTPIEMIRRGVGPSEGYNYAKAREDLIMDDARKNTGALGTALEIGGGVGSGIGLARGGWTFGRALAPEAGVLPRSLASAGDAAAIGGFSGAMEGNGLAERGENALKGAALGGVVGGATPGALSVLGAAARPIVSNVRARVNPEGYAQSQVARAVSESGLTPRQIGQEVVDANAAGQPFTVADAMGNSGQRMLSTVARAPGPGRTDVVNFLEGRQAGQGERVAQILDEGLGSSGTARQTVEQLTKMAQDRAAPFYEAALNKKPVWNERLQQFFEDPVTQGGLKQGVAVQRLESLASGKPFNPKDYAITGFNEAGDPILSGVPNMRTINLIKKGWDNQLEGYRDSTTGKLRLDEYGRALDSVRRSFLQEVDRVNPTYAKARELYAGPAQVRDAVGMGGKAATRGRAEDNIRQFNSLTDQAKQGYRIGYADQQVGKIERAAEGVNKARPFTSDKFRSELGELSLHQGPVAPGSLDPIQQRIARENIMFQTRNQALGGSRTADNLADSAAAGVDPSLIGNILSGNWHGAMRSALAAGSNALTGNTPQVRQEIANILLQRGVKANTLEKMVGDTVARIRFVQNIARNLGRGASGGLAVAGANQNRR